MENEEKKLSVASLISLILHFVLAFIIFLGMGMIIVIQNDAFTLGISLITFVLLIGNIVFASFSIHAINTKKLKGKVFAIISIVLSIIGLLFSFIMYFFAYAMYNPETNAFYCEDMKYCVDKGNGMSECSETLDSSVKVKCKNENIKK